MSEPNVADTEFRLLLDIDALMDTRMGTLLTLDPKLTDWFDVEKYRNREKDDFTELTEGRVTTESFKDLYEKRDSDVLEKSIITGIVPILNNYIETIGERMFRGVDVTSISVDLNFHPFTLAPIVMNSFVNVLYSVLPDYTKVKGVVIDPKKADVTFMKGCYNGWITYDFHTWLEAHHEELIVRPANGLSVILPKLLLKELGDDGVELDPGEALLSADKHGLFEMVMEDFVHLEHIAVEDYCFIMPGRYRLDQSSNDTSASSESEN